MESEIKEAQLEIGLFGDGRANNVSKFFEGQGLLHL